MFPVKLLLIAICSAFTLTATGQYITYVSDIKPIIDRHCISCHTDGEVGAMPLTTYEEVSSYGSMIRYVTGQKIMPPWYADPSYARFRHERVMTAEEIDKIRSWVDSGMPEGALPYGMVISKTAKVTVRPGPPDLVIGMSEAFEQYGLYLDQYQVFVLPTGLTEDRWIQGIELVPGNKKIVRFAAVSVETSDAFDSLDRWDPRYGYYSFGGLGHVPDEAFWYTWTPQQEFTWYPDGEARFLPKNSRLILHIHYGPTGKPQKDSSLIRLHFAKKPPTHEIVTAPLIHPMSLVRDSLLIPPSTKKYFHATCTLPYAIDLMSLTPQANLICRSWEVYAKIPGQHDPVKLLKIPDWNINWKHTYLLPQPVSLPAGTEIHARALYDNTPDNPCNPSDKPIEVGWGAHVFSELFYVHMTYRREVSDSSVVRLQVPVLWSGDVLQGVVSQDKTVFGEIRLQNPVNKGTYALFTPKLKKGTHTLSWDITHIPDGQYLLELHDKKGNLVLQQMVFKLPQKGM